MASLALLAGCSLLPLGRKARLAGHACPRRDERLLERGVPSELGPELVLPREFAVADAQEKVAESLGRTEVGVGGSRALRVSCW